MTLLQMNKTLLTGKHKPVYENRTISLTINIIKIKLRSKVKHLLPHFHCRVLLKMFHPSTMSRLKDISLTDMFKLKSDFQVQNK